MAKVTGPLLSLGATGSIGGAMTFGKWKGVNTCRIKSTPTNPDTANQQTQRGKFGNAVASWKALDEEDQTPWTERATALGLNMSGFNLYVKAYIDQDIVDPAEPTMP